MSSVSIPTPQLVADACVRFDVEDQLVDSALEILFKQYPENTDFRHVLLKVVAVNTLYSTNIFAVKVVAEHISKNVPDLDLSLRAGDPMIVEKISRIKVGSAGKERNFFSFASKFCSWHNQAAFPIYDGRVEEYLWALNKQKPFSERFRRRSDLWSYVTFSQIVSDLRSTFGLSAFTFKQIDKFMYLYSGQEAPAAPDNFEPSALI